MAEGIFVGVRDNSDEVCHSPQRETSGSWIAIQQGALGEVLGKALGSIGTSRPAGRDDRDASGRPRAARRAGMRHAKSPLHQEGQLCLARLH